MRIVIIGGVAGGATVAARLRRLDEKSEIIILEKGEYISFGNCGLPYYVGNEIKQIDDLILHTPESLGQRFNLDIRINSEAMNIDPVRQELLINNHTLHQEYILTYDQLILATGAAPIIPALPGINLPGIFTVRTIPDVIKIKEFIATNKIQTVAVVGGGYIGLEIVEQLHNLNLKLHLIEASAQLLPTFDPEMSAVILTEAKSKGIDVRLSDPLLELEETASCLNLKLKSGQSISAELVILAIGVRPENKLALNAGLELGVTKGVKVNQYLQTSQSNIWAIGDCLEVQDYITKQPAVIALAGPANRQARIVADNIYGAKKVYQGTLGTAVLRFFDLTLASTGASETRLIKSGFQFHKVHLHPNNHVTYYPGVSTINLKVLFSPEGEILGAQAIGKAGVEKRIDVIATAIIGKLTVTDLIDLELSYSPQYGSAKDPVNIAGMIAENILTGKVTQFFAEDLVTLPKDSFLLDVRNDSEIKNGIINNAYHIPLPELRSRLSELPVDREIFVYCQSGQRSYFASRILSQNNFKVKNLSGAFKTYEWVYKFSDN